ncbi:MAG: hypothetical protein M0R51_06735 [Clostridia bacterium]|jgi:hypothetical protein|nr:hypothetical protein [Clostridia bacterium]
MENVLYIQKTTAGNIAQSGNVIFDNVILNSGTMVYNAINGEITFNTIGKYYVNWWVSTQNVSNSLNSAFSLVSSNGVSLVGNSPIKLNSFTGMGVINVTVAPVTARLINTASGTAYLSSNVPIKAMLSAIMFIDSGSSDTMYNFQIMQLANVLSQIIVSYSENVISVFVRGLYYITGNPESLYSSPSGPGLFIVNEEGDIQAIPLNMITAVYAGDASVYDPSISYLSPPALMPSGWDTNVITSVYQYLPVGTAASVYFSIGNSRDGYVYKDEYGMLVVTSDLDGNEPTFIPATEASIIITTIPDLKKAKNIGLKKTDLK